ncbi:undecaprenyl-phosphate glucose phosphotransferase [Hymenobacter sp. BT770]|uniref:undecaprenyl-phosphate glucose phosphotransferase n=1 Tax=Hymenobacter sp. BT770 TaxID=2886942 RepID=UPI001D0F58D7|nr:undecaprenyl-phosphate glucose phosphotransferase [Hymenobacter sp. BT770]MCC3152799.1 undecaprenyl-phosphate glucose phosphotransferase [Hymenobacter sp. BT770]MDO3414874.1 undecaprenyl-phosphate glucose phosphotransferase [Hymenobacter sp. BT770]
MILDLFMLNVIYLFTQQYIPDKLQHGFISPHTFYWLIINIAWILASGVGQIYAYRQLIVFRRFLKSTYTIYFVWAFLVLVSSFLLRAVLPLAREFAYTTILSFSGALLVARMFYLLIRAWVRKKGGLHRRVLILGYNKVAERLATYLESEELSVRIAGFVDDLRKPATHAKYSIFPGISDTLSIARQHGVTEIYSTIMPENNSSVYGMMLQADQDLIRFRIVPDFAYFINRPVHVDYLYELPILSVRKEPLQEVMNRFKKRAFDIVVSLGVCIFILSWLVPLLGIIIYLQSPGPIFFVQKRSGLNNAPFDCFKFRSMTVNQESNTKQATRNDARVTRIGRFMRKTSLDEFPQFLNVLLGQMSIVGPRPHMLKHTVEYSGLEDQYMIRQFLKPGITGWAQVNGFRGEITELRHIQKRVEFDLWYLENWSLSLDLKIMFLTVYNVFKGEENAF